MTRPMCLASCTLILVLVVDSGSRAQSSADIVLRPGRGATVAGAWAVVTDSTAADGVAVRHPNAGAAKLAQALPQPANYFEQTFTPDPGVPYRLWMRGKAQSDNWANDSVFVQFSSSVDSNGAETARIGTSS